MTDPRIPHSGTPMGDDPFHRPPGHERELDRDINLRGLGYTILGLFILTVISMFAMWWMFEWFQEDAVRSDPEPPPLVEARQQTPPPGPRLQAAPERDLEQWRARQNALKTSYGWQDEAAGVVRIPVGRAMELMADEGLEGALGALAVRESLTAQGDTGAANDGAGVPVAEPVPAPFAEPAPAEAAPADSADAGGGA